MTGVVVQVSTSPGGVPNHAVDQGFLTDRGIAGDGWRHPQFHGTRKRAVLLITAEAMDHLKARGYPVFYGALGENLTTRGLDRRLLRIGQLFRAGAAIIQVTETRIPCGALDVYGKTIQSALYDARAQAGDPASPVWGMSGFYASVVQPGLVRPGDEIALVACREKSASHPFDFLSALGRPVAAIALALREVLLEEAPDAVERAYANHPSAVWYGFGPKMGDMFCYIAVASSHVNLGLCRGASLPDPNHVLEGAGKIMRHIKLRSERDLQRPVVRQYIRAAIEHARKAGTSG